MANNAPYPLGPINPGARLNAVVVNAGTVAYDPPLTMIVATGTGTATLVMAQTGTVTVSLSPGVPLDNVAIYQVTTATATGIVGFF